MNWEEAIINTVIFVLVCVSVGVTAWLILHFVRVILWLVQNI
jgi:hypothetical protein